MANLLAILVRAAARTKVANNRIGTDCLSTVVRVNRTWSSRYHPEDGGTEVSAPHFISPDFTVTDVHGRWARESGRIQFKFRPSSTFLCSEPPAEDNP
jgi:hypothetical protein